MKKDETIIEILIRHYKPVNSSDYSLLSDIEDDIELFFLEALKSERQEIISEIAQYSGINDIQTKELIKIIKGL